MTNINSTFDRDPTGEMSVDGSLLEKESPPPYVTFRKAISSSNEGNLRDELLDQFKTFQTKMLSTLEAWFEKQDEKFAALLSDFEGVKTSIKFMSDKYDDLSKKSEDVAARVLVLEKKLSSLYSSEQRVAVLEAKLETIEQKSRNCNIEISNLPERRGENLITIVENISNIIKCPLSSRDIIAIHRVPQLNQTSTRPKNIIVKLSSQIVRDNFVSAARLKKGITSDELKIQGSPHKIYVNEHLTLQNKKLFRQAREIAKQNGHRFVWVKHGIILVRAEVQEAAFTIRSEKDLSKISPYSPKL